MRKIAFVGTAQGEMDAPFNDESFEIWCMNWNTPHYPRVTRDFEIHRFRKNSPVTPQSHAGVQTISQDNFPHAWVEKHLPRYLNDYLYKSTLDYMMAYALYLHKTATKKADKIELVRVCGVQMAINDSEYYHQQPSFSAWIGYALSHFDVVVDDHSPLMKTTNVYGLGEPVVGDPLYNLHTFRQMSEREEQVIKQLTAEIREKQDKIQAHNGTKQVWDLLLKVERARLAGQKIDSIDKLVRPLK